MRGLAGRPFAQVDERGARRRRCRKTRTGQVRWYSIYQPEGQFDQSYNDDCAEDNELSENKLWSVGRANFDYYAPRAHRNVNDVFSTDCALAHWRAGVLLRRVGQIAVSHDDSPRNRDESRADESLVPDRQELCDLAHRASG